MNWATVNVFLILRKSLHSLDGWPVLLVIVFGNQTYRSFFSVFHKLFTYGVPFHISQWFTLDLTEPFSYSYNPSQLPYFLYIFLYTSLGSQSLRGVVLHFISCCKQLQEIFLNFRIQKVSERFENFPKDSEARLEGLANSKDAKRFGRIQKNSKNVS